MPGAATIALRDPRSAARRLLRRHRRPVAAVLAGLGVLVALTALRPAPPLAVDAVAGDALTGSAVRRGEVLVPVALTSGAVASALDVGDIIDLVGLSGDERMTASVVAASARVVEVPAAGSALSGASSGVVLVAVPERAALPLSAASANGGITFVIRAR